MRSVMVFLERLNAAKAIRPTVAALRPVRRARTIGGMLLGMDRTPMPRAAMPIAPGNLRGAQMSENMGVRIWLDIMDLNSTYDQMMKARTPGNVPFLTKAIENASCVDPGPGSALLRAKRSLKVEISSQLSPSTNLRRRMMTCTPGPPNAIVRIQ